MPSQQLSDTRQELEQRITLNARHARIGIALLLVAGLLGIGLSFIVSNTVLGEPMGPIDEWMVLGFRSWASVGKLAGILLVAVAGTDIGWCLLSRRSIAISPSPANQSQWIDSPGLFASSRARQHFVWAWITIIVPPILLGAPLALLWMGWSELIVQLISQPLFDLFQSIASGTFPALQLGLITAIIYIVVPFTILYQSLLHTWFTLHHLQHSSWEQLLEIE
jgi:hypothetical protein